jgi:hypothetical protein
MELNAERLAKLDTLRLTGGSHGSFDDGVCAMEAVAWLAGEPHSDAPKCADPEITIVMIRLNDSMPDAMRNELLRPLLPRLVGSRTNDTAVRRRRAFVLADMACRVFAPLALGAVGYTDLAEELRALPGVIDEKAALFAENKCRLAGGFAAAAHAATAATAATNAASAASAANDSLTAYTASAYAAANACSYAASAAGACRAEATGGFAAAAYAAANACSYAATAAGACRAEATVEAVRMITRMLDIQAQYVLA